jgi:hypothetical protein
MIGHRALQAAPLQGLKVILLLFSCAFVSRALGAIQSQIQLQHIHGGVTDKSK